MNKLNRNIVIAIVGVVVVLIVLIAFILVNRTSQEEKLNNRLKELGKIWYEEIYYPGLGDSDKERSDFLEEYKVSGFKINLDSLSLYSIEKYMKDENIDLKNEFVNDKTKQECDWDKSVVTIYPESPYKINSYRVEVELVCGFDQK